MLENNYSGLVGTSVLKDWVLKLEVRYDCLDSCTFFNHYPFLKFRRYFSDDFSSLRWTHLYYSVDDDYDIYSLYWVCPVYLLFGHVPIVKEKTTFIDQIEKTKYRETLSQ